MLTMPAAAAVVVVAVVGDVDDNGSVPMMVRSCPIPIGREPMMVKVKAAMGKKDVKQSVVMTQKEQEGM